MVQYTFFALWYCIIHVIGMQASKASEVQGFRRWIELDCWGDFGALSFGTRFTATELLLPK